jgi:hypothetical protein
MSRLLLLFLFLGISLVCATLPIKLSSKVAPKASKNEVYGNDHNFVGPWGELPVDSQAHLQRDLQDDKKYVAAILRSPIDNGDPGLCDHKDLEHDKAELKKIALRLEHRRISLNQQKSWITEAESGIKKIEDEMRHTRDTSVNLAKQIDALQNQKQIILNHVRQQLLQKELDQASIQLVRLKKSQVEQTIKTEEELDKHALANKKANTILSLIRQKRTENTKATTPAKKNATPAKKATKPRFQEVESENESEQENESELDSESEKEQE